MICGTHSWVVRKLKCAPESPGGLVITQMAGPHAIIPSDATADGPWTTDLNDSNYSLNKAFLVRIYLIKHSKQNSKEHITCDIKNVQNF